MRWVHIEMDFTCHNHLSSSNYNKLLNLVRYIVMDIKPRRKFFLFEPYPDFFLAMELYKDRLVDIRYYKEISPSFIKEIWFRETPKDKANGEGFLDIMNQYADALLDSKEIKYGHLQHCFLNQMGLDRKQEASWYYLLCKERIRDGTKRSDTKKKVSKRIK